MYAVILDGKLTSPEINWDDATHELSSLFNLNQGEAEQILALTPITIKRVKDEVKAKAIAERIEFCGLSATVKNNISDSSQIDNTDDEPFENTALPNKLNFWQKLKSKFQRP